MNLFLGENTFRIGVSKYLKKHAFGNAEQDDLWESLTTEAHRTQSLPYFMTVKNIMDSWTLQTGYPLITVSINYDTCTTMVYQVIMFKTNKKTKSFRSFLNENPLYFFIITEKIFKS